MITISSGFFEDAVVAGVADALATGGAADADGRVVTRVVAAVVVVVGCDALALAEGTTGAGRAVGADEASGALDGATLLLLLLVASTWLAAASPSDVSPFVCRDDRPMNAPPPTSTAIPATIATDMKRLRSGGARVAGVVIAATDFASATLPPSFDEADDIVASPGRGS